MCTHNQKIGIRPTFHQLLFPSVVILIFHSIMSSAYGLRIVLQNASTYPFLMKNRFRRCCTILLHVIGMGGFAFHLDYLVDLLYNMRDRIRNQLPLEDDASDVKAIEEENTDEQTNNGPKLVSDRRKRGAIRRSRGSKMSVVSNVGSVYENENDGSNEKGGRAENECDDDNVDLEKKDIVMELKDCKTAELGNENPISLDDELREGDRVLKANDRRVSYSLDQPTLKEATKGWNCMKTTRKFQIHKPLFPMSKGARE